MTRKVSVDMTGVESYTRCPEGEWLAKLKKIEEVEIQGSGDDGLKAQFEVIKGDAKGNSVFETFSLAEKALWKLKMCLEAMGMKASGKLKLDLDKMEGKTCVIDVVHDEYNGQKRAKIASYIKPSDSSEDEDDDDEDEEDDEEEEEETPKNTSKKTAPKTSKKSKKKPEPEEEEDEEEEDEDDEEEEEPPKKSKKTSAKKISKKTPAKGKKKSKDEDEDEDDDDDDDWEDEED